MAIMIMLVGLPGSGKTTFSMFSTRPDWVKVSVDEVVEHYATEFGKNFQETYDFFLERANKDMRKLFQDSVSAQKDMVVDLYNLTKKDREFFLNTAGTNYKRICINFRGDLDTLQARLDARARQGGKLVTREKLEEMSAKFQEPSLDEGFDSILEFKVGKA